MRFVKRRNSLRLVMYAGQVSYHEKAISYFKRFCEKIGGRVVEKADVVSCIKETEAVGNLDDYIDEFHNLVNDWKSVLKKPIELVLENRLLGGWSEVSSISYDPKDDEYSLYVRLYNEYGEEPSYVEDIRDETIEEEERIPDLDVTVKAEGEVDQNPATDEFVGVGEAWASTPRTKIRSLFAAPELVRIYRKIVDMANRIAGRAQDELIIPMEAEEW